MKRIFFRTSCLMLAIVMLFTLGACKSSKQDSSDISSSIEVDTNSENLDSTGSENSQNQESSDNQASSDKQTPSNNQTSSNVQSSNTVVKDKLSEVPKSLKGTTITVYTWNAANDVPGATTIIKEFQSKTKIKVSWKVGSYDNYKSEIAAMVAAKNSPDVIRLRGVEPGIISLMDPVTATGYDFKEDIWDSFVSKTYTFNGKVYAVNRSNTLLQQPFVMFYNRDLITKYDLNDPYAIWKRNKANWNWDTFLKMCEDYKKVAGPDAIPWMAHGYKDIAWTYGADLIKRNGDTFVSNMKDANLLKGYQKIMELKEKKIVGFGWDMNGFNTGKYLFFGPPIISARRTHFDLTDLKAKGSLGVVPYPCVAGQTTYYQSVGEVEAYGIPKGAKNAAAVPYFLNMYLDGDKYDSKSFFSDKTILDVYNWCMNETTLVPEYGRYIYQLDLGGTDYTNWTNELKNASPDQMQTILSKYEPVVNRAVKQANDSIAGLN